MPLIHDLESLTDTNPNVDVALLRSVDVLTKDIPAGPTGIQYGLVAPLGDSSIPPEPMIISRNTPLVSR